MFELGLRTPTSCVTYLHGPSSACRGGELISSQNFWSDEPISGSGELTRYDSTRTLISALLTAVQTRDLLLVVGGRILVR